MPCRMKCESLETIIASKNSKESKKKKQVIDRPVEAVLTRPHIPRLELLGRYRRASWITHDKNK